MARGDWGRLMVATQEGDRVAYQRLLQEIRVELCRYFARRLPPSMVDDAVQETLIAIHRKRHTYDPARVFDAWLLAIARYKWIDRLRDMKRHSWDALPEDLEVAGHETAVVSASALDTLLAQLKPAQAAAIRMARVEGLTIEETAVRTGQSQALVKVNIHRGLAKLIALVKTTEYSHG